MQSKHSRVCEVKGNLHMEALGQFYRFNLVLLVRIVVRALIQRRYW